MAKIAEKYDVVIVGAGPTGVTCANYFGLMGLSTLIVDREADILDIPRAIGLDEEGSRVLQSIGLLKEYSKDLLRIEVGKMTSPYTGTFVQVNLNEWLNGHPRLSTMKQPDLERVLRNGLKRFPHVTLATSTEMESFSDDGATVTLDLCSSNSSNDKRFQVQTKYMLACDGARSPVREKLGITMRGKTYGDDWIVIDALKDPKPDRCAEFVCDPRRASVTLPAPHGGRRWEFTLLPGESHEEVLSDETIQELLKDWGDIKDMDIERKVVYTFNARIATQFKEGNVFLLGDAAHLTPPFAGQGLMAALRDANNLCWKIGMVVKGKADKRLLDSYQLERKKNVRNMIRAAVVMGMFIMPRNKLTAYIRDAFFGLLNLIPPIKRNLSNLSMKPVNAFQDGYFIKSKNFGGLVAGDTHPQELMQLENGEQEMLDDTIGLNWAIIGFGFDPSNYLAEGQSSKWKAWEGKIIHLEEPGTNFTDSNPKTLRLVDIEGAFKGIAGTDMCLVVRPDRHIACMVPAHELGRNLDKYLQMGINHSIRFESTSALKLA